MESNFVVIVPGKIRLQIVDHKIMFLQQEYDNGLEDVCYWEKTPREITTAIVAISPLIHRQNTGKEVGLLDVYYRIERIIGLPNPE